MFISEIHQQLSQYVLTQMAHGTDSRPHTPRKTLSLRMSHDQISVQILTSVFIYCGFSQFSGADKPAGCKGNALNRVSVVYFFFLFIE